jgi:anhydro-N-acetylmuramic acid kinase
MVDQRRSYDRDGRIAAQGKVNESVLAELLGDRFFAAAPPKSTGRERFGDGYARALYDRLPGPDAVATAVELTARTVADAVGRFTPPGVEVVVSGGGCHHPGLMEALGRHLRERGGHPLRRFEELFFAGDAKEAVAFALLGYLTLHGQPGNLPAATGAGGSRVLGAVTPA